MKRITIVNDKRYPSFREAWRAQGWSLPIDRTHRKVRELMMRVGSAVYNGVTFIRGQ